MKWAIVGSRDFKKIFAIEDFIRMIKEDGDCTEILTGDARGVDAEAKRCGERLGIPVKVYPADWKKHGSAAGLMRNTDIIRDADKVLAFWDGKSRGTADSIGKARAMGKDTRVLTDNS